eukprot:12923977-Ditylum_brightwellii.AAC.1
MAEYVFPKKAGQTQKCSMQRNLWLVGGMTVKKQPLDDNELLDILECGVPGLWHREFTVQGFDPVDQGLRKFVEFCTRLELCESRTDKPKDEKSPKSRIARRCKVDTPTKPA